MRLLLLALLLLGSATVHAQRNLNSQAFQSTVRPLLTGIINDFYQMVSLFPSFPKEIVAVVRRLEELEEFREGLRQSCPRQLNSDCLETVDKLRARLSAVTSEVLELWRGQAPETTVYMTTLIGMRHLTEFQTELNSLKGDLDNSSFLIRARIQEKNPTYAVLKKLDELRTLLSLTVVEFLPYQYKEDFRSFFFNFVHPIEIHVGKNKNYEFFNRNVNSLNFSINLLVQNLTKRNKKTPDGMAPYLALIHNRWNGVLRYYY